MVTYNGEGIDEAFIESMVHVGPEILKPSGIIEGCVLLACAQILETNGSALTCKLLWVSTCACGRFVCVHVRVRARTNWLRLVPVELVEISCCLVFLFPMIRFAQCCQIAVGSVYCLLVLLTEVCVA